MASCPLVGSDFATTILEWTVTTQWGVIPGVTSGPGLVKGLTLRGTGTYDGTNAAAGILLGAQNYVTVENCLIENWGYAGIQMGGSGSSNHTVRGCVLRNNWNSGCFLAEANDCLIDECEVYGNYYNGLDSNGSRNIFRHCNVHENCLSNSTPGDRCGIFICALSGTTISDNLIDGCHVWGNNEHNIACIAVTTGTLTRTRISNTMVNGSVVGAGINLDALNPGGAVSFVTVTGVQAFANAAGGILSLGCSFNMIAATIAGSNVGDGFTIQDTATQACDCVAQGNSGKSFWIVSPANYSAVKNCVHSGNGTDAVTNSGSNSQLSGNYP